MLRIVLTIYSMNKILPLENKGYRRGSYGCPDHLLINKMSYKITIIGLGNYLETKEDRMIISVKENERNKEKFSSVIQKKSKKFKRVFQVGEKVQIKHNTPTALANYKKKKEKIKCKCNTPDAETMTSVFIVNILPIQNKQT